MELAWWEKEASLYRGVRWASRSNMSSVNSWRAYHWIEVHMSDSWANVNIPSRKMQPLRLGGWSAVHALATKLSATQRQGL
jgi:hypothetical protein